MIAQYSRLVFLYATILGWYISDILSLHQISELVINSTGICLIQLMKKSKTNVEKSTLTQLK